MSVFSVEWRALRPLTSLLRAGAALSLALACLTTALVAQAQTCSIPGRAGVGSINAQPNTFFPGTGSPAAGATSITVGVGTGPTAIAAGDLLLIIQMQGADLNTTDSNAYGAGTGPVLTVSSTVAYGASGYAGGVSGNLVAGTYEWAVATNAVTVAGGGTINLMSPLANSYFTRAASTTVTKQAFQVIRVPQYSNLTLTGGFTIQAWNGSVGGVLVLEATGDLNLGGFTINGNGAGFRGAGPVVVTPNATCTGNYNTSGCPQYVATIAAALGASKGEGIAGTPGRIYTGDPAGAGTGAVTAGTVDGYPVGEAARGAPGNAGGGGNQHNAGGGGGANGGAGGQGGNTWNSSVNGFAGLPLGGFGGSPPGTSASKWFLGGGGGAGDIGGNTWTSPQGAGGAGGGLVILRAGRIVGPGTINLNGAPGITTNSTDASGGGGAGGTAVVTVGSGGLSGALTVNASGGKGGSYTVAGLEQDGPGGGGGGGVLITNLVSGITFNANGGLGGGSSTTSGCAAASNACGAAAGIATAGQAGYAITSPGVQVGYECLPNLTVTKATGTPVVTTTTGATASYTINISNSGGGARYVSVLDTNLPPGWTLNAAPTYSYSPVQPVAAGRLSAGGEATALNTANAWSVVATPLTVPANGSNALTWTSFALPPIVGGVPSSVTLSFVASIPNTATAGTYHNGAGITFLDPTRLAAAPTRTVSPATNVTANRTAAAYSANTTYANFAGAATTSVGGSNYSGLQAGPTGEDVRLVPDFSVVKTASASVTPGATFSYTITPGNTGRAVATQTYTITQATDVSSANIGPLLGSNPLTVTDTLPSGVTVSTPFSVNGWTCNANGATGFVCTLPNAAAFPIAATTTFPSIPATATLTRACSTSSAAFTNTATVSLGAGETISANNTATAATTPTCLSANLTVTKTNGVNTLVAGSTTSYTITVANLGPSNAPGTVVTDPPSTGLGSCTNLTCAVTGTASCPSPLTVSALQSTGLTITPTFNANSTVTFALTCTVTATGQ